MSELTTRAAKAVRQIYPAIKKELPELPVILQFNLENDEEMARRQHVVSAVT